MDHQKPVLRGYLFVTSGSRLSSDVTSLPAAKTQMTALRNLAASKGAQLDIAAWDCSPKITSLDVLANLFGALEETEQSVLNGHDEPWIYIDDYSRLFRDVTNEMKSVLWDELLRYEEHVRDINTQKSIFELSPFDKELIRAGRTPTGTVDREVEDRSLGKRKPQKQSESEIPGAILGKKARRLGSDD